MSVHGFDLVPENLDAGARQWRHRHGRMPLAAVKDAEIVITMLPAGKHVLSVYEEIAPWAAKGALFIDCSTIDVEFGAQGACDRRQAWPAVDRRAGFGRHRRAPRPAR